MTYLMNEKICQHCSHKDVCYMYKDIREGKKWYKEYFDEDVLCPYLYNHMTTMTNMFNVVETPTTHGRLIDADKLLEAMGKAVDEDGYWTNFFAVVEDAPTIIEEEC